MSVAPKVSVITPFLDASRFIREAIDSVLAQSYPDWELLLVDDGSTDGSTQTARSYAECHKGRIRYYDHERHTNRGTTASRNLGIRASSGQYVAFLDADDVWLPHKLARQVAILDSQPDAAMLYGASQYWYSWNGLPGDATRDHVCDIGVCPDTLFQPPILLNLLLKGLHSPGPSDVMARREALHRIGGFEESFYGPNQLYEDQAFLAKVYLQEPVFVSNECWDRYRIHEGSCDATVIKAGQHHAARLFFLHWLRAYLADKRVEEAELLTNLKDALAPYVDRDVHDQRNFADSHLRDDSEARRLNWWLKVEADSVADLDILDREGATARVAIKQAGTSLRHDIQLNYTRLKLDVNETYVISFMARADRVRSIVISMARSYPPWTNLGLYDQIQLTSDWQYVERRFVATGGSLNARIHFDLGGSAIPVELSGLRLRSLGDGRSIDPDVPAANPPARSNGEPRPAMPERNR